MPIPVLLTGKIKARNAASTENKRPFKVSRLAVHLSSISLLQRAVLNGTGFY